MKKTKAKRITIIVLILVIVAFLITTIALYFTNLQVRTWMDEKIFRKTINDAKLPTIEIEDEKNSTIVAYGNNIAKYSNNVLTIYDSNANKKSEININVEKPEIVSNGNYLLIADQGQNDAYLIYRESLQWKKELDGKVSKISLNRNGAVAVALSETSYKTVIVMYDITGDEEFKTYLSTTIASDLAISDNGRYLSFIEVDTSGATLKSKVQTISVEKARANEENSMKVALEEQVNTLLVKLQYKNDDLIILADNGVYTYDNNESKKVIDKSDDTTFSDNNLNGYVCFVKETKDGNELDIVNPFNVDKPIVYNLKDSAKSICTSRNVIAVNVGNEIDFIDRSGILIKKYTSLKNVKDVIVGENIAGIVYKDRVEIVNL